VPAEAVLARVDDGVAHIRLNRPDLSNAFDLDTARAFGDAVTLAASDSVRVILIDGEGPRFCAGGDVRSMASAAEPSKYLAELAAELEKHLRRLSELPKPVVAAVHGAVAGAGLAVILNSDVIIAARSTKFLLAYSSVGLTPDCGVSYLLPRTVGLHRALDFAVRERTLNSEEAQAWGLVSEVVDDDALEGQAQQLVRQLCNRPASALGQAKRLLRSSFGGSRIESAEDEVNSIATAVASPDAQRLIAKFTAR